MIAFEAFLLRFIPSGAFMVHILLGGVKNQFWKTDACEFIAINRSRINADFIGLQKRFGQGCVAKNNQFPEIIFCLDELSPYPEQIL